MGNLGFQGCLSLVFFPFALSCWFSVVQFWCPYLCSVFLVDKQWRPARRSWEANQVERGREREGKADVIQGWSSGQRGRTGESHRITQS